MYYRRKRQFSDAWFILIGLAHKYFRLAIRGPRDVRKYKFIDFDVHDAEKNNEVFLFDFDEPKYSKVRFPVENAVLGPFNDRKASFQRNGIKSRTTATFKFDLWLHFIKNSRIPEGYFYSGLYYGGYILDGHRGWCLPSWVWTNGAIVRLYSRLGKKEMVAELADKFVKLQLDNGGWLVRLDYNLDDIVPVCAPNDSAYIAASVMLEAHELLGSKVYLNSALRCAEWVIETSLKNGLVSTAYDMKKRRWTSGNIIVDVGFTAVLFSKLILAGHDSTGKFKNFLDKFIAQYILCFFDSKTRLFHTSVNSQYKGEGGYFSRGQAWALEGLISAYLVSPTKELKMVIESTVMKLLELQCKGGAWHYNLSKKYLGLDCKGAPVIAKSLITWYNINPDVRILDSAKRALDWCKKNTSLNEDRSLGGIFAYSMEGAIVHNLYSNATMVYTSAYAYECYLEMKGL